jgi:hypothetical protein
MSVLLPLIWLRNGFSNVLNYFRRTTTWEPPLPSNLSTIGALQYMGAWCVDHMAWKSDLANGYLDNVQSVGYMNWRDNGNS